MLDASSRRRLCHSNTRWSAFSVWGLIWVLMQSCRTFVRYFQNLFPMCHGGTWGKSLEFAKNMHHGACSCCVTVAQRSSPPLCAMAVSRNYTAIHNPSLNLCHRVTHLSKSRCQRCRWKPASCRGAPSRNGRQIFFFCQPPHVCATVAQHTAALPTAEKCGNILH